MNKDILDKLQLKNKENLSSDRVSKSSALGLFRDVNKMKIDDDFSNDEYIEDEFSIIESNSYIDLTDSLDEAGKYKKSNRIKANLSSIAYDNEMTD